MKALKLSYILGLFVLFFLFPSNIFAHILKTDGSIGAVLHIDPEDDPIVNQVATFFFEFKDTQGKFNLNDCDCQIIITKENQQIYSTPLEQIPNDQPTNASFSYTFPERNIYAVTIRGTPKTAQAFSQFKLVYDIRVARGENATTETNIPTPTPEPKWWITNSVYLVVGAIIFVALLALLVMRKMKSKKVTTPVAPPTETAKTETEPSNQKEDVK